MNIIRFIVIATVGILSQQVALADDFTCEFLSKNEASLECDRIYPEKSCQSDPKQIGELRVKLKDATWQPKKESYSWNFYLKVKMRSEKGDGVEKTQIALGKDGAHKCKPWEGEGKCIVRVAKEDLDCQYSISDSASNSDQSKTCSFKMPLYGQMLGAGIVKKSQVSLSASVAVVKLHNSGNTDGLWETDCQFKSL